MTTKRGRPQGKSNAPAKSTAERQRDLKARKTKEGWKRVTVYIGPNAQARLERLRVAAERARGVPITQSQVIGWALELAEGMTTAGDKKPD